MSHFLFSRYLNKQNKKSPKATFEQLLKIFLELINITGGNVAEALAWLNNLDSKYGLTDDSYGMGDFIEDLKKKGYIKEEQVGGKWIITPKSERTIRQQALEEIFGKLKRGKSGNHRTTYDGSNSGEALPELRPYEFGDDLQQLALTESLRNAYIHHGIDDFLLTQDDLEVREQEQYVQTSTVLMIDVSHSMILYGEDRITPAKKVAMALAELIMRKYPKDTLDIIAFGNDAWQISIKELPYLQVGPFHTNTVAGLELAMDLLRRRKTPNKQIFMITDGKPTCIKEGIRYYKNSFGLDRKILNKTLNLAKQCRRLGIPITTFMIATDPYLQEFVRKFTQVNGGRAYYSSLQGLGDYLFEDYQRNRRRYMRGGS